MPTILFTAIAATVVMLPLAVSGVTGPGSPSPASAQDTVLNQQPLAGVGGGSLFEYCMSESPLRRGLTRESFDVVDGYIAVPEEPGLGVTINQDVFDTYRVA